MAHQGKNAVRHYDRLQNPGNFWVIIYSYAVNKIIDFLGKKNIYD